MPAIVEAIRSGKIQCRVYRKEKFHAKAYITHGRAAVVGSFGLVGSSNFTYPGLVQNVELNTQVSGTEVGLLQAWYERHWDEAEDVTPEVLRTIERHVQDRTPFEVYFKALDEYFRGQALTPDLWDQQESSVWKILAKYQQDAYKNLIAIANRYGGAFLCDGVGLGKTFVGLMLIERLVVRESKRVVLFAPKTAREDVWERVVQRYLPELNSGFVNFVLYNHTDLQRKGKFARNLELTLRDADVVIIDEAHHFRNPGVKGTGEKEPSRYRKLQRLLHSGDRPRQLFMLTATPVNNSVHDFRYLTELFTDADDRFFGNQLGVQNLRAHFIQLERRLLGKLPDGNTLMLEVGADIREAERALRSDTVFDALVVQRSRAYVKESQRQQGANEALFPDRAAPKVVAYNLKAIYGKLLTSVEKAFNKQKPLFVLSIYYPLAYWKGDKDDPEYQAFDEGRQKQVVSLIRTQFLKRFESSASAFEESCWRLMQKLLAWAMIHAESDHELHRLDRWQTKNADLLGLRQMHLFPDDAEDDLVEEFVNEQALGAVIKLDAGQFDVGAILSDTFEDLNQLAEFLRLAGEVQPERDDKLRALIKLLKTDPVLKREKVILFSEFADTARYLKQQLSAAGITGLEQIDGSSSQTQRSDVIRRFAPYYNESSSAEVRQAGSEEIRVLISTDILAEGLNLQDATRLINYDLHWNPVRLMQRIGRVDRRMNPEVEARLLADHPEQQALRGTVQFWNFLPPGELDDLLRLFQRVTNKTLIISRTLGIEGSQLLTPDDAFDPIKELNEQVDGTLSNLEMLRLEYDALLEQHPDLAATLPALPLKVFSGRRGARPGAARTAFFCYRIPRPDPALVSVNGEENGAGAAGAGGLRWSETAGFTVWLAYHLDSKRILTDAGAIADLIRSGPDTPRHCEIAQADLTEARRMMEKKLTADYLKTLQAPLGVSPVLKCWMEIN